MPDRETASHLGSCRRIHQSGDSKEVVCGPKHVRGELVATVAAEASLSEVADGFHPTEDFLNSFAEALTDRVARLARRASVNRGPALPGDVLRDVGRDVPVAACRDEVPRVEALVPGQGRTP